MNGMKHLSRKRLGRLALATLLFSVQPAFAEDNYWIGGEWHPYSSSTGDNNTWEFFESYNWSLGQSPTSVHNVFFDNTYSYSWNNYFSVWILHTDTIVNNAVIGNEQHGYFSQMESRLSIADTLTLGKQQGSFGNYEMGGIYTYRNEWMEEEVYYEPIYRWECDDYGCNEVFAGYDEHRFSNFFSEEYLVTVNGGHLQAQNLVIGDGGQGSFIQTSPGYGESTTTVSGTSTLGKQQGSSGSYELSGRNSWNQGILNTTNLIIGDRGTGTFVQGGYSTTTVSSNVTLGLNHGSRGEYTLAGADDGSTGKAVLNAVDVVIGDGGEGIFHQGNFSQFNIIGSLTIANQSTSEGLLKVSGGALTAPQIIVGVAGHGEYEQTGGQVTTNTMSISSNSTATLSGGALLVNDSLTNEGLLTLTQAGLLTVGNTFTNTGTLVIDLGTYTGGSFITLLHSTADLDGELKIINSTGRSLEGVTFDLLYAEGALLGDLDFEGHVTADLGDFRFAGLSLVGNGLRLNLTSGPAAVPTPSSILLLSSALLMLAGWRQRSMQ